MIGFYLFATLLATLCAFLNSFGIVEVASTALLICACLKAKDVNIAKSFLICVSSLLIAFLSAVAIYCFTSDSPNFTLPSVWLSLSQVLYPFLVALSIVICIINKKDPITTATIAIAISSLFILTTNCIGIFISYDCFGFDAIRLYVNDMSIEFTKLIETQNVGLLAQKVYVSFMTRMIASLLPGIFIMLSVIYVFITLFIVKVALKDKLEKFHKGPWAVSISLISAIINVFCIIAFTSSLFSSSVSVFTAVAGNIMLILTPASAILGFAFMTFGIRKGGIINVIVSALPIVMLFIAPPAAIIYISFIGSASVIFSKIMLAILKSK